MQNIKVVPEGDSGLLIQFEQVISPAINQRIAAIVKLIHYNPQAISYKELHHRIESIVKMDTKTESITKKVYEIPTCYGGKYGPDLKNIAEHAGLSEEEVIRIHSSSDYLIYMLGFLPGFTYLGDSRTGGRLYPFCAGK